MEEIAQHVKELTGEDLDEICQQSGRSDDDVGEARWILHSLILHANKFGQALHVSEGESVSNLFLCISYSPVRFLTIFIICDIEVNNETFVQSESDIEVNNETFVQPESDMGVNNETFVQHEDTAEIVAEQTEMSTIQDHISTDNEPNVATESV
ncbi:unnamed protein product [Mytilus edulis]|uniref:Uncharacterized protein n=1 Tax=Mytilus edulis TaxID=6550 RepID=A0A8S3R5X6_MYTED|nr:unnamed protein product [Mytilus edulis]